MHATAAPRPYYFESATVDLSEPCVVIGGRNGAGKSRILRAIQGELDGAGLLLNMHQLVEQALMVLRSRDDLEAMREEYDSLGPDAERLDDLKRVVARDYEGIEWFGLEIEPDDTEIAERFRWTGDQAIFPYVVARYRSREYSALNMGLGEFSVHFLFWILEQYRDHEGLTLLLDEPDAYLPPVGVTSLLSRLVRIAAKRRWRIVVATHSEKMIRRAIDEEAFVLLRIDDQGVVVAESAAGNPAVGSSLLSRYAIEHVVFCEDETAVNLAAALIQASDSTLARSTSLVWGNGHGYLRQLHSHLPKPPKPEVKFAYVFDGDQRDSLPEVADDRWRSICLPSDSDPDELLRTAAGRRGPLAARLGTSEMELARLLDTLEGTDAHDWVSGIGDQYGRQLALKALTSLWAEENEGIAAAWVEELRQALS